MTHDAIVVGAGLAGLTAALRLAEGGRRVLVVAKGVGATHLAPGTIDVLGYAPDRVESPARALARFADAHPEHPYARVPLELVAASIAWLKERVASPRYVGGLDENLLLPTAVGAVRPSAVVPGAIAAGDVRAGGRLAIVGLRGLKDFYAHYLADNLARAALPGGARLSTRALELAPPLDGEGDVSALGFARLFEQPRFRETVSRELDGRLEPGEHVGFPATLGLDCAAAVWRELTDRLERPVFEIPTLPPSVPGIRLFRALSTALRRAGGRLVVGSPVVGFERRGHRVAAVMVQTAARAVPHEAESFVLASGGIASGGIEMDSYGKVREVVFDLPVAAVPAEGKPRFRARYFDDHPLARVGVAVDERFHPVDEAGRPIHTNLRAAGAVLAGASPWREKSGDGISLATGYAAASAILAEGS